MVIKSIIHALYSPSAITSLVGPGGISLVRGNMRYMPMRTPVLLSQILWLFPPVSAIFAGIAILLTASVPFLSQVCISLTRTSK